MAEEKKLANNQRPRINKSKDTEPDWTHPCENCGELPTVPATGLCGPCTFGEADTIGGNW